MIGLRDGAGKLQRRFHPLTGLEIPPRNGVVRVK
jgi:hypothetical protein